MELFEERALQLKTESGEDLRVSDVELADIALDPYLLWACETQFRYYKNSATETDTDARLLIELSETGALGGTGVTALAKLDSVSIAECYTSPALHLRDTHFLTATVQLRSFVETLQAKPDVRVMIKALTLSMLISPETGEAQTPGSSALWPDGFDEATYQKLCKTKGTRSAEVIAGVVDDGIGFLNDQFCHQMPDKQGQTRFIAYWDQNSPPRKGGYGQNASTGYGQVFNRQAIEDMRQSPYAPAHVYRKERLYRLDRGQSHGTAVLDIAAGNSRDKNQATTSLLAVQLLLPRSGDDNSGGWLDGALLDALRFMLDQVDKQWVDQIGNGGDSNLALPQLVVNVSYSTQRGAHDGSSAITRAIDELIEKRMVNNQHTLAVVFSAGNELQSRIHVEVPALAPGESKEFLWQLPPDDDTPSFVELWAKGPQPKFSVMLIAPEEANNPCVHITGAGTQAHARDTNNHILASAIANSIYASDGCMALLALAPTNRNEFGGAKANFGTWTIRVKNTSDEPISINGWIQSDRSRMGESNRGRQSSFRDIHYRKRVNNQDAMKKGVPPGSFETEDQAECCIKRSNTLNALATGKHTLSAAGYLKDTGHYADYAALGKNGWNTGPDVATVCQTNSIKGLPVCSTYSGGHTQLSGTSAAAPQLTNRLVSRLETHPNESPQEALQALIEEDREEIAQRYDKPLQPNGEEIPRLLDKRVVFPE